jgi:hypothetical protein
VNKHLSPLLSVRQPLKHTVIVLLGLFVAAQIAFSPVIDNVTESFLRSYIGLEFPHGLKMIPFKSFLIFWLMILSIFIFMRFLNTGIIWLIDRKEKVFITSILLSSQLIALSPVRRLEISDLVVVVVLFLWFLYIFTDKEHKIIWSPSYILLLLLLLSVLLSTINGGLGSVLKLPSVIKNITVFFIMVNIIRDREIAIFSLRILFLVATFSAIIGILQEIIFFFTGMTLIGFISERGKEFMWQSTPFGKLLRVSALTGWYTVLSYFLSIAIIVGTNLILYSIPTRKKERLFLYIAVPLMSIALFLTFSRSTMLSLLLAIIVLILIRWRSLSIHFVTIFLVGILVAYLSGFITDFLEEPKKYILIEDLNIRISLLRDGLSGFSNHPFIGNGIEQGYRYTSDVYHWPVHNIVVLIADELGLFGIFAYGAFFFVFIYKQVIFILKVKDKKDKAVSLSLLIALIAYMTDLQFQTPYIDLTLFMYLGFMEAIIRTFSYQVPLETNAKS